MEREQSRPEKLIQPGERELRYDDPASAVAEEGLIRLLYLDGSLAGDGSLPTAEEFSSPVLGHIYSVVRQRLRDHRPVSADVLGNDLSAEEISLLVKLLQKPETMSNSRQALADYINRIRQRRRESEKSDDLMQILAEKRKELK